MKRHFNSLIAAMLILSGCTTQQKLAYLNNLSPDGSSETFAMEIPDYRIQYRDILYITVKGMTIDGRITDFLSSASGIGTSTYAQGEAGQYLIGYDVNANGEILVPALGKISVGGRTLYEARMIVQDSADRHFNNSTVECKLLSFKFTVLGEVRSPGTYINYNNYLTILEALGRAGGINDFGRRDRITVVRPFEKGTKTYSLSLRDKSILNSEAYFLMPNDVVIVEPEGRKIFNLNLPVYSFIITTVTSVFTTTLLLINYLGK